MMRATDGIFFSIGSNGVETMLCLSRKKNEVIRIGDNIKLMVIEIRGDKVRLGIEAPRDVAVHREEVWLAIKHEEEQASEQ